VARRAFAAALLSFAAFAIHAETSAPAAPPAEQKLIEELIHEVGQMHDVVFIRNGTEYSAQDAQSHLRDKLDYFKDDIHTAEDFIRLCATRSEMSGQAYQVRDASGHVQDSSAFLKARLDRLRQAAKH
jgi:hypothetical protein